VFFLIAGIIGVIGGSAGAWYAVTAHKRRLPEEAGRRPLLERTCAAILDHFTVISAPGCRFAMYDEFIVIRAPGLAMLVRYPDIVSVEVKTTGFPRGVILHVRGSIYAETVKLMFGNQNERIAGLIEQCRATSER
jgi:hypothetical protein